MLKILGWHKTACTGLTRRDLLWAGGLAFAGFGTDELLRLQQAHGGMTGAGQGFGKAKQCILIYLFGGASQLETFDPKPFAPADIRGELGSIETSIPGYRVCEFLPRIAEILDRTTVVRSLTHPYPIHGSAFTLTSTPTLDVRMQLNAQDPKHWPYIGSVVQYLDELGFDRSAIPRVRNVALPWLLSSRRPHPSRNGGPYGAFLGSTYDPIWTDFRGQATQAANYVFGGKVARVMDPYGGIEPDYHFTFSTQTEETQIQLDALDRRISLLTQLKRAQRRFGTERTRAFDRHQHLANSLVTSSPVADALDADREDRSIREEYGMNLFGQSCLVARRLIESGVKFVTVFWDEVGSVNAAWDTHYEHYPRLKTQLLPGLDTGLAALVKDLDRRGLLDETLVVCTTEHGRTPKITSQDQGGRDHWSRAYSSILAGGGLARGRVIGTTDRIAGDVADSPVSPKDILATMYHLLGVDPNAIIKDNSGREFRVAGEGQLLPEVIA